MSRGFTMIEMMIVACVITILALVGFANFGRYSEKTNRQEATALLSQYYAYAKSASAEFLCNPGNFVSLGFNPVGQIKSRILAANGDCTLPLGYPNNNNDCISTAFDKTHTEDGGTECRDPPIPTPLDEYYFPSWTETASIDGVADNECPAVNGVNVTAVNKDDLTFRTLACLIIDPSAKPFPKAAVACICHNGVIGGNEEACSKDDCKQPQP